jgi:site-specific recombinase XerD
MLQHWWFLAVVEAKVCVTRRFTVTHLRQMMLDELQRRNYSPNTVRSYVHAVEEFARYFRRSPDQLGPDHVREYQVHLFRDRKLSSRTIEGQAAALRFLFVKTLRRAYLPDAIPFPKCHKRLPTVLSQEEVTRLIDSTGNLMHRAMVMMLYATGVRRAELCRLKVGDIDSERMGPCVASLALPMHSRRRLRTMRLRLRFTSCITTFAASTRHYALLPRWRPV